MAEAQYIVSNNLIEYFKFARGVAWASLLQMVRRLLSYDTKYIKRIC